MDKTPSPASLEPIDTHDLPPGALYVVATPIGHLDDLSGRAKRLLKVADVVCAEDTRHSATLLRALQAHPKHLISVHEHNERSRADQVCAWVQEGARVALISDAGTPAISDPGARLVDAVLHAQLKVIPIPGACAAIAALSVAGFFEGPFLFEGFLPPKAGARDKVIAQRVLDTAHCLFYEAPHRLIDTLEALNRVAPQRRLLLAREITKQFETLYRGTVSEVLAFCAADPMQRKGEIVLILEGRAEVTPAHVSALKPLLQALLEELPPSTASKVAAKVTGESRANCYEVAENLARERRNSNRA